MSATDDIFRDVPDEIDESWQHGALVGGMVDLAVKERGALAGSFKRAGDTLLAASFADDSAHELVYPVLFNYRHSIELYLKAIVEPNQRNHDLRGLIRQFQQAVLDRLSTRCPLGSSSASVNSTTLTVARRPSATPSPVWYRSRVNSRVRRGSTFTASST